MDAIDISSDDSDLREIDNYTDESPLRDSATSRILPSWATGKELTFFPLPATNLC